MEVVDSMYQSWDNYEITVGIFLDLQKALDTVNYIMSFRKKLELYGIRGRTHIVLKWFSSYLSNKTVHCIRKL